jgi:N-ethylmaleimide reductase
MSGSLFEPVQLGPLTLRNRVVMAPMTRSRAAAGNTTTPLTATYYEQRASAGLIVSEGAQVSPEGVGYPNTPGIHTDEQVEAWRRVTGAVHGRGGHIYLQLWHVGRISHPSLQPGGALPVGPSPIAAAGRIYTATGMQPFVAPRALETAEIARVVGDFAAATRRARAAGFDGVEVHGANGYLIDQFLRSSTNQRTDAYGGSIENRARFLLEVVEAVAGAWEPGRVGVRLSPTGPFNDISDADPVATFGYVAEALNGFGGLAYLHVREPMTAGEPSAGAVVTAHELRRRFEGPFIINEGYGRESAEAAIASNAADLVAFGVPFISNPDLVERLASGAPLAPADSSTFYGGDARGYTDYPTRDGAAEAEAAAA